MSILLYTKEMFELIVNNNSIKLENNYEVEFRKIETGYNIIVITSIDISNIINSFNNINNILLRFYSNIIFDFIEKESFFTYNNNILDIFIYK